VSSLFTSQNRKLKVLMFGWEFPPFVAGGLGMACYGLVKSMIKKGMHVTLVLPKNVTASREEGLTILGADFFEFCVNKKITDLKIQTVTLETQIQAYSTVDAPLELSVLSEEAIEHVFTERVKAGDYVQENKAVYGPNLIDEVNRYNQIAGSIAASLDYDVIHCHDWLTFGAGVVAKEISGKPLFCHVHATEFDRSAGTGNHEVRHLEKMGCEKADRVMAVSYYTKDILIKNYGIDARKIEVVHNGIEMQGPPPSPRGMSSSAPRILFLGRVTYQKGPNYFLEAAHQVLKLRPDAQFIIAGAGDMVSYLKGRTKELGISDKVSFTGMLSEEQVKEIYQSVDCFVLSSVSEPFGLTVLEALSHRLPVIISKQSGVSEVLRHVLRYDFWDVERLASLILSVITYPSLAQELKDRSVEDLYPISWDQVVNRVEKTYASVLNGKQLAGV
jgi:glycogen synthase